MYVVWTAPLHFLSVLNLTVFSALVLYFQMFSLAFF
jgi:hypothetical protein